ncbi:MAG: signal peptidase II [Actinomycetota bacterium]|nr:signal peptidase II [Actinomycetota bacterium]
MRDNGTADTDSETGSAAVRDDDRRGRTPDLNPRQTAVFVAVAILLIDQLTKAWAVSALSDGPIVLIEGLLQLRLTYNTGAAFSMFQQGGPVLAVIAVGVIGVIMLVLGDASRRSEAIALGMVLGGSLGNLYDRITGSQGFLDGAVVDFIDFDFFATFNVADMSISLGVGLLLLVTFLRRS